MNEDPTLFAIRAATLLGPRVGSLCEVCYAGRQTLTSRATRSSAVTACAFPKVKTGADLAQRGAVVCINSIGRAAGTE